MRHQMMKTIALITAALLLAPIAGRAEVPALKGWQCSVALGLTLTRGNSRTLSANGAVLAENLLKHDEFRLGGDLSYGEQEINGVNSTTAQSAHGFGDWKHLFTDRFYSDLRLDGYHDHVADLSYRIIVGPAAGYYFIKNARSRLSAEAGVSYITERKGGTDDNYIALRLGERGEHSFNPQWKVWEQVDILPQVDKFENYIVLAEAGTEAALNAHLSLRVVLRDQYNNRPAPGRGSNDLTLITALAYKF